MYGLKLDLPAWHWKMMNVHGLKGTVAHVLLTNDECK